MSQPIDPEGPEGLVVFRCGDRAYRCVDIIEAADFRGEIDAQRRESAAGYERAVRAAELELEVPDESLDALTEPFRYERNLISAEETERWLEDRRLTLEDYEDYFVRRHWMSVEDGELGAEGEPVEELDPDEALRVLTIDLLMSGKLDRMARELAWRVAALTAGDAELPSHEIDARREEFFERTGTASDTLPAWLARHGGDAERFEELLRMEAAFARRRDAVLTPAARDRALRIQRLDFVRFDVEVLELDSADAAREAYLCAAKDGMSLGQLAEETRYPYTRAQILAGQLDDEHRQRLISARPGEVLAPTNGGGRHQLCRVVAKIDPAIDDAEIRARVDDLLVTQHFGELAGRHVQWVLAGEAAE